MTTDSLVPMPPRSNVPEMSVSGLASALRQTLEETFGRVRVRGELSGLKLASSGHLYGDIKDEDAVINIVCWRGTLARLKVKPEDGLEVTCTGKVSSYPKSSRYQIVVDNIELAGEGALLKMLEDRRKKLAAEGLFDPARKKELPYLPEVIGVITSPTGAVIRDILHRLADRFPRPVILWPVAVQGEDAAAQIAAAIRGFDALPANGPVPRPDVLIVARGGGSLEDLMAFNEEIVVRAAASCSIPLISAVGHETDTTLIDHAADRRAPTPTAAAEMAVPVRSALREQLHTQEHRLSRTLERLLSLQGERIAGLSKRLGDPARLLELKTQMLDHAAHRVDSGLERVIRQCETRLARLSGALPAPRQRLAEAGKLLTLRGEQLAAAWPRLLDDRKKQIDHACRMLKSLSYESVLERGYAVVRAESGKIVTAASDAPSGTVLDIELHGKARLKAVSR